MPVPTSAIFNLAVMPKSNADMGIAVLAASMLTEVRNLRREVFMVILVIDCT
jgi:hypothetical protein